MPILHPDLYDAVYATLHRQMASLPMRRPGGTPRVYRAGPAVHAGRAGADRFRTVYQSSTNDGNRWTGPRPRPVTSGKPAAGGIYTSIGFNDALIGEFSFYAFGTTLDEDVQRRVAGKATTLSAATFSLKLSERRIFEYEYPQGLPMVDFSLSSRAGQELLHALDRAPIVRLALQGARYPSARDAYLASADHSLPRAMAQLVRDVLPGVRAIWVSSARAGSAVQLQDQEGDNLVFFGADGAIVSELRPVREIWFERQPNGSFKDVSAPLAGTGAFPKP
jgi:hypothetical protein